MKRIFTALIITCFVAGTVWAGSYVYYDAVTLNSNASTNQTTSVVKDFMQTMVVCDKEASGTVNASVKFAGMTDFAAESTIDLTGTDRTVTWTNPGITTVNFESGDSGACRVFQADK